MQKHLEKLLDELLYLKREGINDIYCEEETLNQLKLSIKNKINATIPENPFPEPHKTYTTQQYTYTSPDDNNSNQDAQKSLSIHQTFQKL